MAIFKKFIGHFNGNDSENGKETMEMNLWKIKDFFKDYKNFKWWIVEMQDTKFEKNIFKDEEWNVIWVWLNEVWKGTQSWYQICLLNNYYIIRFDKNQYIIKKDWDKFLNISLPSQEVSVNDITLVMDGETVFKGKNVTNQKTKNPEDNNESNSWSPEVYESVETVKQTDYDELNSSEVLWSLDTDFVMWLLKQGFSQLKEMLQIYDSENSRMGILWEKTRGEISGAIW